MRVLHVVPTYLPATRYGGPVYSVHGLCAGLARRGHDVHVYTTNVDGAGISDVPLEAAVDRDGVAVTYFPTAYGRRIYRAPRMALALGGHVSTFEVVHLHSVFLWPTAVAAATARRAGRPYVLSPRGMLVSGLIRRKSNLPKRLWIEIFERHNLAQAAAVHVTTEAEVEEIGRLGLSARRFETIPNGIELEAVSATKRASTNERPTILFLGRVHWKKGLDRLIRAMSHVAKTVPAAELVIVGNDEEGYRPRLKEIARVSGVSARVRFVGPVHGAEKWRMLSTGAVFALPSYSENFGIAVLEAMAAGVPVVVTPEVGLAPTVAETGAGLVVDGAPETLGDALAFLLTNPKERQRMGAAGRRAVVERFAWDSIAVRMEALYSELAAGGATLQGEGAGPAAALDRSPS